MLRNNADAHISSLGYLWCNMSRTMDSCFIAGSRHWETDKSTRPEAERFRLFRGVWNPWWSTKSDFLTCHLKWNNKNANASVWSQEKHVSSQMKIWWSFMGIINFTSFTGHKNQNKNHETMPNRALSVSRTRRFDCRFYLVSLVIKIHPPDPNSRHFLAFDCMNNWWVWELLRNLFFVVIFYRFAK